MRCLPTVWVPLSYRPSLAALDPKSAAEAASGLTLPDARQPLPTAHNRQGGCWGALIVDDGGHPLLGSTVGQFPGAGLAREPADTTGLSFE